MSSSVKHIKKHPYPIWLQDGFWKKGQSGNPKGRPKVPTLKERVRKMIENMTPEQEKDFLLRITPSDVWRMAEGNPHQTKDITSGGKPIGQLLDEMGDDE